MNKNDLQLFRTIAQMKQNTLLKSMSRLLEKYYSKDKILTTQDYILCGEGNIPIMLVAHMDTVFKTPPERIYYDHKQRTMWSPQGLGADDRAGVFAIVKILQHGYRPSICLTTDEEKGGFGAMALTKDFPACPFDLRYIIELDRQGTNDCVFYDCANEKFTEYVEKFGFVSDWGTFTDICDICPVWGVAGVNLSIGYKNEHREIETLNTNALYSTIKKVENMLDVVNNTEKFAYIPDKNPWYYTKMFQKYNGYGFFIDEDEDPYYSTMYPASFNKENCLCHRCHRKFSEDDVFPVKLRGYKNAKTYYCVDCVADGVNWCSICGEPFETTEENDVLCPDCAERGSEE